MCVCKARGELEGDYGPIGASIRVVAFARDDPNDRMGMLKVVVRCNPLHASGPSGDRKGHGTHQSRGSEVSMD